jgi:hypothetical protein
MATGTRKLARKVENFVKYLEMTHTQHYCSTSCRQTREDTIERALHMPSKRYFAGDLQSSSVIGAWDQTNFCSTTSSLERQLHVPALKLMTRQASGCAPAWFVPRRTNRDQKQENLNMVIGVLSYEHGSRPKQIVARFQQDRARSGRSKELRLPTIAPHLISNPCTLIIIGPSSDQRRPMVSSFINQSDDIHCLGSVVLR